VPTRPMPDDLAAATRAVESNYTAARAAIEAIAINDPQLAFEFATELRDRLDRLVGNAAELRALTVERVWESEKLSLAALAKRIGVSKARADQFIQAARATKEHPEDS
jgi:3-methyladenine DNA glycosylase/8-oxoguanine DNA glycosylase